MIAKLVDAFFGCRHSHYSFPLTVKTGLRRGSAARVTGTYVACLNCGKEFAYDWHQMKIVDASFLAHHRLHELAPKKAA